MLRRLSALGLALGLLPGLLSAASVVDLYQVSEPVSSGQDQQQALHGALDQLLIRLTGSKAVLDKPELARLREHPEQVANRYEQKGGQLAVDFDGVAVGRALDQAQVPVWGQQRASLLAWWVEHNPDEGNTLMIDSQSESAALHDSAKARGLPLVLPMGDLQEQSLTDQGGDDSAFSGEVKRYGTDGLLKVSAGPNDYGHWLGQWQLSLGDKNASGKVEADDRQGLVDEVMSAVLANMAPWYATAGSGVPQQTLELQVDGADLSHYGELQRALEPYGGKLLHMQGQQLLFQVKARPDELRQALTAIGLQESAQPSDDGDDGVVQIDDNGQLSVDTQLPPQQQPQSQSQRLYYRW